jgi:glycosyltransferase involved in cell wall biosynthesis
VSQLRVLYLIDSLGPGGAQRQLVTLVRALDRAAVSPEVAYYHPIEHFRPELESAGVPIHELGPGGGRDPRVTGRLARLMRTGRFDIVHAMLRTPGVLARVAAALAPGPRLVVSERNVGLGESRGRLALERALSRQADAMIVNAEAIRHELVELIPAWAPRVHVVPNGIEWKEPTEEERRVAQEFRDENIGDAELLIGAVGRVERQKAPELLVEALALLPPSALDRLRVVWVGPWIDTDLKRLVETRARELPLAGRFSFLPETRDTRSVYIGVDCVVMPSRWEGMPNVILESLAHGTPVVATDVGDAARLIRRPSAGRLVPADDPEALSCAMASLIAAPLEQRRAMGARGAAFVLDEYSAERLAQRTTAVYEHVMRGRSAGSREAT